MTYAPPLPAQRDNELDAAVSTLSARGDNVGVVRVVEAWSGQGTPTLRGRILEARAFFHLRLMDRALARTREVLDVDPDHADALQLQAQVYVERGWPLKARKPLQQLRDAGRDDLDALWARAHADPVRPEATAREVEREAVPARLLALAESFLATGSFLRATGILERLRRNDPDNARVKDLLWGIAGDFGGGQSLDALLASLLPTTLPREHTSDEPEHTESLDLRASDLDPEAAGAAAFPALFKYASASAAFADADPHEATQSSGLASAAEMGDAAGGGTDPGRRLVDMTGAGPNDTQIMLVLRPGEDRNAPVHRRRDEGGEGLRDTLNLRAWQQSMGMNAGSDLTDAPDDLLEEEDENVVVMTRGESSPAAPAPRETFDTPIEVIEKHGVPIAAAAPPAPEAAAPAPLPPRPREEAAPAPAPRAASSRLLVPLAALAVVGLLVIGVATVGGLAAGAGGDESRQELVHALSSEDYNALLTQEGRLEQRIATGVRASEVSEVRAALAEARLVLWSDYNGDPTRLAKVQEDLSESTRLDVHRLAVLRAAEALARQDIAGAAAALGRERPADDEERLLFARIAWRGGDLDRAIQHFSSMERGEAPRYLLARAEILAQAGRQSEARAAVNVVLQGHPGHAAATILRIELADLAPENVLLEVAGLLASPAGKNLPPRLEGRLEVLRARAYLARRDMPAAREAIERGLARDGANPDLLYLLAADLAGAQKLTAALHEITTVVEARPGSAEAQTAYILLLLDLDRVEQAENAVFALEAEKMLPELTPVLDTLVSVWGLQERPSTALLPPQLTTPLGATAAALLSVQERSPDALTALALAADALQSSADPFLRRLAPRLVAMKAVVAGDPDGEPLARAALDANAEDPAVHLFVARFYEAADKKVLAAQHFDRAAQLGPEFGLAWYEKGRFYLDARDGFARSGAAWRNFMALAPSGPRAVRAKDTLGLR